MSYDASSYPRVAVTVDLVVLTIRDGDFSVLLVRRGEPPYRGRWALPGGFVAPDEDLEGAAVRELHEETGVAGLHVEQLASYGAPRRDPRMRVVTVAHLAIGPDLPDARAGSDAAHAQWVPMEVAQEARLAFDHARILADGVERARSKLEYTPLAAEFCREPFTVSDLRQVYEAVWGQELDPRNFHRKVTGVPGFLEPTGETRQEGRGRPAQLYRRRNAELLLPPMMRD